MIRQIYDVKLHDTVTIRSNELLAQLGIEDLDLILKESKLHWYGHMELSNSVVKTTLTYRLLESMGLGGQRWHGSSWQRGITDRHSWQTHLEIWCDICHACSKPATWKGTHWCPCCPCTCTLIKNLRYCTKTMQVFFWHVVFSVTETDETIKIYKEYSKMDWKRMKQMKQTNSSFHWFLNSIDQGVWTVSSCFVTNEMNETDHQWELLLVCFICFILFQSILEYSLYILIVSSVSVMEKKTCRKKTCLVLCSIWKSGININKKSGDDDDDDDLHLFWSQASGLTDL